MILGWTSTFEGSAPPVLAAKPTLGFPRVFVPTPGTPA